MTRTTFWFLALSQAAAFFHYLFNFIMGKMLAVSEFGILVSLLNLSMVVTVPLLALQTIVTTFVARWEAQGAQDKIAALWDRLIRQAAVIGVVVSLAVLLMAPLLQRALNLPSVWPAVILAAIPLPATLMPAMRGMLQGLHAFLPLGGNMLVEGVVRCAAGAVLVMMGGQAGEGLAATPVSGCLAFAAGAWWLARTRPRVPGGVVDLKELYQFGLPATAAQILLTVMMLMDVPIVRARFPPELAGIYASAETMGKVVLFLPAPFVFLMFPKVTALEARGESSRRLLWTTLLLTLGASLAVTLAYWLIGPFIVRRLFDSRYLAATSLIPVLGLAMTGFAAVYVLVFYNLSRQRTAFLWPFVVLVALQAVFLLFVPQSPSHFAWSLAGFSAAHVVFQSWFVRL